MALAVGDSSMRAMRANLQSVARMARMGKSGAHGVNRWCMEMHAVHVYAVQDAPLGSDQK